MFSFKRNLVWVSIGICFLCGSLAAKNYDLSVIGFVNHADGLGRQSIILIDMLKDDLDINLISMPGQMNKTDISPAIQKIVSNPDKKPGVVSILEYPVWRVGSEPYKYVPKESKIKIAYSMLESSKIPQEWVKIFNSHFDAIAVPDPFLIDIYHACGVQIPVFFVALPIYIDDFLNRPRVKRPHKPFVFGCTFSGEVRKNIPTLIKAFAKEFWNSDKAVLKLNCRYMDPDVKAECDKLITTLKLKNVILTSKVLNHAEYLEFMDSFDCLVSISRGEGFSITPREALAMGLPCIATNNSGQITICNSGLVRSVPSDIQVKVDYPCLGNDQGYMWDCTIADVRQALRDVYSNYEVYLEKAAQGPAWVSQYRPSNLKQKYLNLIKPANVILGDHNEITDDYLMTNSPALFEKYSKSFN